MNPYEPPIALPVPDVKPRRRWWVALSLFVAAATAFVYGRLFTFRHGWDFGGVDPTERCEAIFHTYDVIFYARILPAQSWCVTAYEATINVGPEIGRQQYLILGIAFVLLFAAAIATIRPPRAWIWLVATTALIGAITLHYANTSPEFAPPPAAWAKADKQAAAPNAKLRAPVNPIPALSAAEFIETLAAEIKQVVPEMAGWPQANYICLQRSGHFGTIVKHSFSANDVTKGAAEQIVVTLVGRHIPSSPSDYRDNAHGWDTFRWLLTSQDVAGIAQVSLTFNADSTQPEGLGDIDLDITTSCLAATS